MMALFTPDLQLFSPQWCPSLLTHSSLVPAALRTRTSRHRFPLRGPRAVLVPGRCPAGSGATRLGAARFPGPATDTAWG
ncbi:hypothetical protein Y1Q_0019729 [Alligator mississippiensis]|uniref:Uncharacterized protein n=1 Tax=Alligator mississippiensis TaxID=8496 RepID=A0A151PF35_ALLMI|nr:hypothetical protein Y1Q_0019729 [Alligator mississippiensis]